MHIYIHTYCRERWFILYYEIFMTTISQSVTSQHQQLHHYAKKRMYVTIITVAHGLLVGIRRFHCSTNSCFTAEANASIAKICKTHCQSGQLSLLRILSLVVCGGFPEAHLCNQGGSFRPKYTCKQFLQNAINIYNSKFLGLH